ncbi:transposase domain protein [Leptospira santarosai str. ZUN179]|uniref:Transposase domain protein n=1 Tax=Leptospira santarosai str. ZUN179 TaxID=1049985 RepID=M6UZ16_9LEPT|nr:transposase domain protein [Leptospira santarosai str. ZUN179]
MKSQDSNYVGIDCGKKSLEVIRINSEGSYERQQFSTTEIGISKLINWLNPNDVVGLEAGSQSFRIAKSILNKGIHNRIESRRFSNNLSIFKKDG